MKKLENLSSFKSEIKSDELAKIQGGAFQKPTRQKTESHDSDGNVTDKCVLKDKESWFSHK